MKFQQKIDELKNNIVETLAPLVKSDYVLLDLPYHSNIGDILIWEGEEAFLNGLDYKCIYRASSDTFVQANIKDEMTTIFLHGGGNFGDVWPKHQKFRMQIVQKYVNNPIIVFPQTVSYSSEEQIIKEANLMSIHKNLTICARDQRSFELLQKYFRNNILLLPDMAFCIEQTKLRKFVKPRFDKELFLKRNDKELATNYDYSNLFSIDKLIETKDWPTKEKGNLLHKLLIKPIHPKTPFKAFANLYAYNFYKDHLINEGVGFLTTYSHIYTTRLHGAILSLLLHIPFTFFDNSYGKNKGFYDAWLSDLEEISFVNS